MLTPAGRRDRSWERSDCSAATTSHRRPDTKPPADRTTVVRQRALSIPIGEPLPPDQIAEAHDRVDAGTRERVLRSIPNWATKLTRPVETCSRLSAELGRDRAGSQTAHLIEIRSVGRSRLGDVHLATACSPTERRPQPRRRLPLTQGKQATAPCMPRLAGCSPAVARCSSSTESGASLPVPGRRRSPAVWPLDQCCMVSPSRSMTGAPGCCSGRSVGESRVARRIDPGSCLTVKPRAAVGVTESAMPGMVWASLGCRVGRSGCLG